MHAPMNLEDFYRKTMEANGIVRESESIDKIAEAKGVDAAMIKMAKAVYDQTLIDDVSYDTPQQRLSDAMKIAESYVNYMDSVKTASNVLATDLLRVASHAVEGYLSQRGISDLSAIDGVKIAAVCGEELIAKVAEPGSDFVMRMMEARAKSKGKKDDEVAEEKSEKTDKK